MGEEGEEEEGEEGGRGGESVGVRACVSVCTCTETC